MHETKSEKMKFVVLLLFFGTSVCTAIDERPNALLVTTIGQTSQLIGSKASSGKLEVGDFVISKTGLLQFKSKTNAFRLLPLVKFPGELISITILDHQDQVYVARFVEPGGAEWKVTTTFALEQLMVKCWQAHWSLVVHWSGCLVTYFCDLQPMSMIDIVKPCLE